MCQANAEQDQGHRALLAKAARKPRETPRAPRVGNAAALVSSESRPTVVSSVIDAAVPLDVCGLDRREVGSGPVVVAARARRGGESGASFPGAWRRPGHVVLSDSPPTRAPGVWWLRTARVTSMGGSRRFP